MAKLLAELPATAAESPLLRRKPPRKAGMAKPSAAPARDAATPFVRVAHSVFCSVVKMTAVSAVGMRL